MTKLETLEKEARALKALAYIAAQMKNAQQYAKLERQLEQKYREIDKERKNATN